MKTTIKIYQIKDIANTIYAFRSYNKDMFNFEDYEQVFESTYETIGEQVEIDLENVFKLGNDGTLKSLVNHMHSISTSDIIVIDGAAFYIQSIGFKLLGKEEDL